MKTKTEPKTETAKHTPGAIRCADIIIGEGIDGRGRVNTIQTAWGRKTREGIADLIDRETAAPELLALLKKAGTALRQYQAILEWQTAPEKMRPGLPYSSRYPYGIDVEKEIAQAIAQAEGRVI